MSAYLDRDEKKVRRFILRQPHDRNKAKPLDNYFTIPELERFGICFVCNDNFRSLPYGACEEGHVICRACYFPLKTLLASETITCCVTMEAGSRVCHSEFKVISLECGLPEFWALFLDRNTFACSGVQYGCDFVGIGTDVVEHEMLDCGFQTFVMTGGPPTSLQKEVKDEGPSLLDWMKVVNEEKRPQREMDVEKTSTNPILKESPKKGTFGDKISIISKRGRKAASKAKKIGAQIVAKALEVLPEENEPTDPPKHWPWTKDEEKNVACKVENSTQPEDTNKLKVCKPQIQEKGKSIKVVLWDAGELASTPSQKVFPILVHVPTTNPQKHEFRTRPLLSPENTGTIQRRVKREPLATWGIPEDVSQWQPLI